MGRIVHFGLGNFARAHLLDYTADAGGWDVIGVSLKTTKARDGLAAQGFNYTLCVQGGATKQIDVLKDILVAPEDPDLVLDVMQDAQIISATVTEKGYHLNANGALDTSDPAIMAELAGGPPTTLIGFLAHALAQRTEPVTVLSCDNRVENGTSLERAVRDFANASDMRINWDLVTFPNAMVDRITPATSQEIRAKTGDPMAVPTEAFSEWVIEDRFAGPRPDWPNVQFVSDVRPHELRKLRMLNGAHSLLAYGGLALGYVYVHEAICDPTLRAQTEALMGEAGATLPDEIRAQVAPYATSLIARFENPALQHRLDQIAMDGSQKVPYRLVAVLRAGPAPAAAFGMRAWVLFCINQTQAGIALIDPLADQLAHAAQSDHPEKDILAVVNAADLHARIFEGA